MHYFSVKLLSLLALIVLFQRGACRPLSNNTTNGNYANGGFARANGIHFLAENGKPLYLNGFNAYWMMYMGSDPSSHDKVSSVLSQASKNGMNMVRTWAFNDGNRYRALQTSPSSYDEQVFKGLDFVISEAKKYNIYLILSLVNNWDDFGGRSQYVQWAKDRGQSVNGKDDFFTNSVIKGFYKDHVKAVLTRVNTITGVAYKDDPTIFAWELMNEPRCQSDYSSGKCLQDWVVEMATYVKSIDGNHLLEVGLEGFYGQTAPERQQTNPNGWLVGSDFISNNQVPQVDFATIHLYPEQWLSSANEEDQAAFVDRWVQTHIQDSKAILGKPLIVAEFGKSSRTTPRFSVEKRDNYFGKMFNAIYNSAKDGGPCVGGLFWQLQAQGMSEFSDGYDFILEDSPSTANVITQQSRKLASL